MPSGLASPDAILAICLPEPAPTEATSPVSSQHLGAQLLAEPLDVGRAGPGELDGLAERLVERQLFEHRHHRRTVVNTRPLAIAVHRAARRQHHGRRPTSLRA